MKNENIAIFVVISLVILTAFVTADEPNINPYNRDLFNLKGKLVVHPIENSIDSLSDPEFLELVDENGLPIWFARYFFKDICVTGICNMAKFWIFWDGTGKYLGFRLNNNEPLTKNNHIDFLPQDYVRLDEILKDTESILQDFNYENLAVESEIEVAEESSIYTVDAFTSATPPGLSEYVVEDAVFTCYTLWHTVYGETQKKIQTLLTERMDPGYIEKLLRGNKDQQMFALEQIAVNLKLIAEFEEVLFQLITSNDLALSKKTVSLFPSDYFDYSENQLKFINLINNSLPEIKYEIIYRLQELDSLSTGSLILLLDKYTEGVISIAGLNQVYRIVANYKSKKHIDFEKVISKIEILSKSPNLETSHLSTNFLRSIK